MNITVKELSGGYKFIYQTHDGERIDYVLEVQDLRPYGPRGPLRDPEWVWVHCDGKCDYVTNMDGGVTIESVEQLIYHFPSKGRRITRKEQACRQALNFYRSNTPAPKMGPKDSEGFFTKLEDAQAEEADDERRAVVYILRNPTLWSTEALHDACRKAADIIMKE